jgi:predicted amidophosphoribosyltransferase
MNGVRWRTLLDLCFPPQCAACNALGTGLCVRCAPSQVPIRIRLPTLAVTALGSYEGALRAAVLALKDGRRDVAEALAERLTPLLDSRALLVPVPTTARRRRVRGVDGVELVARRAAQAAGTRTVAALIQQAGDSQRGRSRAARLKAFGRFSCQGQEVAARRVTLVDDVCTTGATLRDCAAAVRAAGGVVEQAVVVAVTKSQQPWRAPTRD